MSRLDNDPVFQYRISQLGGYGVTQEYLDNIVDKHFPIEGPNKFSDVFKMDLWDDPEDTNSNFLI